MKYFVSALFLSVIALLSPASAQEAQQKSLIVPEIAAPSTAASCTQPAAGDALVCIAKGHIASKPLHFYTGEYTAFSEADFGPRYDPRNYAGYDPIAADMCKRFAPNMKAPVINYTEFKSISGGCCGYAFFVMSCTDIQ
ncbi:hypothetical protein HU675_0035325 [Bradyrhizobium septentrionale]|uniref:hypothetical protein n=1 Tax=Bradyrhizobium septentrionale TaxID=1404411 RepID=UPI0015964F07|nr:hypothetical protein [Bradyrhizobium septentrionale]UGY23190.1 hypothetical protein HU675_0035325 [Bradyrhizobium septentrionale]